MSESKANKAIRAELMAREAETSSKIQLILEEDKFALQPFMQYSEFGIAPRVRLVDTTNQTKEAEEVTSDNETNNADKETDTGEVAVNEESDGASTTEST